MKQQHNRPDAKGFDTMSRREGFHNPSFKGVTHRIHWWFPTHFFKFQDVLLNWENLCRKQKWPFLFDRTQITFLDLGCGAGAASIALLSSLEQYQIFRRIRARQIHPITVNLIGLERCQAELEAYTTLISAYKPFMARQQIRVNITTLCSSFPEGIKQILQHLSNTSGHVLIVGMSNLIKWIWQEWDADQQRKDITIFEKLKAEEAHALKRLSAETDFDIIHIIGTATKNKHLFRKLYDLGRKCLQLLKSIQHPLGQERHFVRSNIVFKNPEGSGWTQPSYSTTYFAESLIDIAPEFHQDSDLHQVLSAKNLEAAWVKVRSLLRYESIADLVEIKLFESNLEENLKWLRQVSVDRNYAQWNIDFDLPYQYPKNAQTDRPRSLPRLEEQIIAASVCLHFAKQLDGEHPEVSYSHKLAPLESEFLYEYWFARYKAYLADILKSLDHRHICVLDIQSYYTHIHQAKLLNVLEDRLQESTRCYDLLAHIISRDCHAQHQHGFGILQGHAISGLLANVMLQPMDKQLVEHWNMKGRFFRFADDMSITASEVPQDDIEHVQTSLTSIDRALKLNKSKEFQGKAEHYKRKVQNYQGLNSLSARFHSLILPLFVLNVSYFLEFYRSGWKFVHEYQQILQESELYFSPEWLYRKLDEYSRISKWIVRTLRKRKWRLKLPSYSYISDEVHAQWATEFQKNNAAWIQERNTLKSNLSGILRWAAKKLLNGETEEDYIRRYQRIVKFALYRLSVFGIDQVLPETTQLLLSQPWSIPVSIACRGLARIGEDDLLLQILNGSNSPYVRAMVLRAFGKVRSQNSVFILGQILDNPAHEAIEKLMASEALLDLDLWESIELDRVLKWLEQESLSPYIQKNIVLILGQAYLPKAQHILEEMGHDMQHPIIGQALHYALTKSATENLLWRPEPNILRKYRASYYPEIEELLGDNDYSPPISI